MFRLRILLTGVQDFPGGGARPQPAIVQRSGTKTSPRMPAPRNWQGRGDAKFAINATTVARYGKDDMNSDGIGTWSAWNGAAE